MQYLSSPNCIPLLLAEALKTSEIRGTVFTQEYPDSVVTVPTIVWRVNHRVPGNEGKETKGPRNRGGQQILNHTTIVNYPTQWYTVVYQFDLFHASNAKVDELMERFETFAIEANKGLKAVGISYFGFYEQLQDYTLPVPKEIPSRSLRYQATFPVTRPVYLPRIRQIARFISVKALITDNGDEGVEEVTRGDSDVDQVSLPVAAITTIADASRSTEPDYIAGVDYELAVAESGHATDITWTLAGKRPVAGSTYYVMYSDIDAYMYQTIT